MALGYEEKQSGFQLETLVGKLNFFLVKLF